MSEAVVGKAVEAAARRVAVRVGLRRMIREALARAGSKARALILWRRAVGEAVPAHVLRLPKSLLARYRAIVGLATETAKAHGYRGITSLLERYKRDAAFAEKVNETIKRLVSTRSEYSFLKGYSPRAILETAARLKPSWRSLIRLQVSPEKALLARGFMRGVMSATVNLLSATVLQGVPHAHTAIATLHNRIADSTYIFEMRMMELRRMMMNMAMKQAGATE